VEHAKTLEETVKHSLTGGQEVRGSNPRVPTKNPTESKALQTEPTSGRSIGSSQCLKRIYAGALARVGCVGYVTAAVLVAAVAGVAQADDYEWRRAVDVEYVEMTAAQVSTSYMRKMREKYGHPNYPAAEAWRGAGLALLWKREDGVYVCNIYVLDIEDRRVLEHEIRHCHGWVHD
jgi:hypothetical protein